MWTSLLFRAKTSLLYMYMHTSTNLLRYKKNTMKNDQVTGGSFSSFCRCHSNCTRREVFSRGEWTVRFFFSLSFSLFSPCCSSTLKRPVRRPILIHYVLIARARQVAFSLSLSAYTYTISCCEHIGWEHERIYINIQCFRTLMWNITLPMYRKRTPYGSSLLNRIILRYNTTSVSAKRNQCISYITRKKPSFDSFYRD